MNIFITGMYDKKINVCVSIKGLVEIDCVAGGIILHYLERGVSPCVVTQRCHFAKYHSMMEGLTCYAVKHHALEPYNRCIDDIHVSLFRATGSH